MNSCSRLLLVIEPWCCHYEIIPSVLHTNAGYYNKVIICIQIQLARNAVNVLRRLSDRVRVRYDNAIRYVEELQL